jgi:hypothetical protein
MRILLWHVHGSWTTAFVQGPHTYLLPVDSERGPDGLGRARTWQWPRSAVEVPLERLGETGIDLVVLQRPHEFELVRRLTGRTPGVDLPAVYLEHNTPVGAVPDTPHPLAGRPGVRIVHVTGFNELFWDCGSSRTAVIEHGVLDSGALWTGDRASAAVVVNEPIRRGRSVGTDLLPGFAERVQLDVFGLDTAGLAGKLGVPADRCRCHGELPQAEMHAEVARSRVYLHPMRWTSLGLSLLEAMTMAMPVVVLGATDAARAVPTGAGLVSTSVSELCDAAARYVRDRDAAHDAGALARQSALARYGLGRFLSDWDELIDEEVAR